MVKINKTLGLALFTALAASCSSDNDVAQSNPTVENNNGVAYATLRIDLPTQAGSRAVTYADGDASEYIVHNATLLVFKQAGNKEGDYKFVEAVDLTNPTDGTADKDNGITTEKKYTARLTKYSTATTDKDSYYGLVLLNNNYTKEGATVQKVTLPTAGQTFSYWNENTSGAGLTNTFDGYYMASAPGWTTAGQVPLTLTHIDPAKVKFTQDEANTAGPAATIHVERGVAKVSLSSTSGNEVDATNYTSTKDTVQINGWALDVTNKTSYPVHNVDSLATDYADIWKSNGSKPTDRTASVERFVDGSNSVFKRVYWAKDHNYSLGTGYISGTDAFTQCGTQFNMINTSKDGKTGDYSIAVSTAVGTPLYCLENTFNIDNMTQGQTTRVVFKATYKLNGATPASTFYKVGSTLYTLDGLKTELSNIIKNLFGKTAGDDYVLNLAANGNDITSASGTYEIKDANLEKKPSGAKALTRGGTATANNVFTKDQIDLINSNLKGGISTYLNGVCYYIGRIKHFGDLETPWKPGDPTYGTGDEANKKYLGRYGLVRNNWYELNVESIAGPGEPIVPPVVPENPDDDNNHYINLSVKILSWAKRSQDINL